MLGYKRRYNEMDTLLKAFSDGSGTPAPPTGFKVNGVDVNQHYARLADGTQGDAIGFKIGGLDLNNIFAAISNQGSLLSFQSFGSNTKAIDNRIYDVSGNLCIFIKRLINGSWMLGRYQYDPTTGGSTTIVSSLLGDSDNLYSITTNGLNIYIRKKADYQTKLYRLDMNFVELAVYNIANTDTTGTEMAKMFISPINGTIVEVSTYGGKIGIYGGQTGTVTRAYSSVAGLSMNAFYGISFTFYDIFLNIDDPATGRSKIYKFKRTTGELTSYYDQAYPADDSYEFVAQSYVGATTRFVAWVDANYVLHVVDIDQGHNYDTFDLKIGYAYADVQGAYTLRVAVEDGRVYVLIPRLAHPDKLLAIAMSKSISIIIGYDDEGLELYQTVHVQPEVIVEYDMPMIAGKSLPSSNIAQSGTAIKQGTSHYFCPYDEGFYILPQEPDVTLTVTVPDDFAVGDFDMTASTNYYNITPDNYPPLKIFDNDTNAVLLLIPFGVNAAPIPGVYTCTFPAGTKIRCGQVKAAENAASPPLKYTIAFGFNSQQTKRIFSNTSITVGMIATDDESIMGHADYYAVVPIQITVPEYSESEGIGPIAYDEAYRFPLTVTDTWTGQVLISIQASGDGSIPEPGIYTAEVQLNTPVKLHEARLTDGFLGTWAWGIGPVGGTSTIPIKTDMAATWATSYVSQSDINVATARYYID